MNTTMTTLTTALANTNAAIAAINAANAAAAAANAPAATNTALTMSSREIADLTGKRHDHVMRDIGNMLVDLEIDVPSFGGMSPDAYGRPQPIFNLPHRETLILLTGYSVPMRAKVVDRWTELEAQVARTAPAIPATYAEALRLAASQHEELTAANHQIALSAPKVAVFDRVIADKHMTISDFTKRLAGVNTICTKRDLAGMKYLFRQGKGYEVYSKYRDSLFGMGVEDSRGNREITVLAKGKELLAQLHASGQLTMKVGHVKASTALAVAR